MFMISKQELDNLALRLVNAMILEGPDNEQELHLLQVLLDPEEHDDLQVVVTDAQDYCDAAFNSFTNNINNMLEELDAECTDTYEVHLCKGCIAQLDEDYPYTVPRDRLTIVEVPISECDNIDMSTYDDKLLERNKYYRPKEE